MIAENPAAKEFIARLRWTHIDLEHAEVSIFTEKTGRAQIIPIAAPLLRFMTQELPAHDDPAAPLFPRAHENVQRLILISSLRHLVKMYLPFVFTNQHAYPVMAEYYSDLEHLDQIDWEILQKRDFKHDPDDPGKKERYQAEALVYRYVPIEALLGIACFNGKVEATLKSEIDSRDLKLQVILKPSWYF